MSIALILAASAGAATADYAAPRNSQESAERLQALYPQRALQHGESAAALMDLQVDPEGRVLECETITVHGSKSLGYRICALQKKVRVTPATIGGRPAYGAYRTVAAFYLPGGREVAAVRPVASAAFTVTDLPDGVDSLRLGLVMVIAPDGTVSRCKGVDSRHPDFASAACAEISKVTFTPLRDAEGNPVQHVRDFSVEFTLAK